jgi:hypothetical protein
MEIWQSRPFTSPVKMELCNGFIKSRGHRYLIGSDQCETKISEFRLIIPKGRDYKKPWRETKGNTTHSLTTYWPTDFNKTPDLLDFLNIRSNLERPSVHITIIATISTLIITHQNHQIAQQPKKFGSIRNWYRRKFSTQHPAQTAKDIEEATAEITSAIHKQFGAQHQRQTSDRISRIPMRSQGAN